MYRHMIIILQQPSQHTQGIYPMLFQLGQRPGLWAHIETTLDECPLSAGFAC